MAPELPMSPNPSSTATREPSITRMSLAPSITSVRGAWWKSSRTPTKTLRQGLCSNKAFDKFAQQVGFKVDRAAHGSLAQGRDFPRVRYDPDVETPPPHRRHGQ